MALWERPGLIVFLAAVGLLCLPDAGCQPTREITAEMFRVERIVDGDTFVILYDGDLTRVRLYSGDAPERGEAGFAEATDHLRGLIEGRNVRLVFPGPRKRDHYGRLLADVYIDGIEVNCQSPIDN